jgi:hypothetical protein
LPLGANDFQCARDPYIERRSALFYAANGYVIVIKPSKIPVRQLAVGAIPAALASLIGVDFLVRHKS